MEEEKFDFPEEHPCRSGFCCGVKLCRVFLFVRWCGNCGAIYSPWLNNVRPNLEVCATCVSWIVNDEKTRMICSFLSDNDCTFHTSAGCTCKKYFSRRPFVGNSIRFALALLRAGD